ncbi:hypothetical protein BpHYR1_042860 [Brachionus plicatilis]|uniref:Uncharacterized protein n=1 Tax=Brachionus plicatilis TaxID=10195 RepID=A0A3M7PVU2_BRAPC|nr:hypothetical protein BpHYR1_042860 [Brachionus plicatilis]
MITINVIFGHFELLNSHIPSPLCKQMMKYEREKFEHLNGDNFDCEPSDQSLNTNYVIKWSQNSINFHTKCLKLVFILSGKFRNKKLKQLKKAILGLRGIVNFKLNRTMNTTSIRLKVKKVQHSMLHYICPNEKSN